MCFEDCLRRSQGVIVVNDSCDSAAAILGFRSKRQERFVASKREEPTAFHCPLMHTLLSFERRLNQANPSSHAYIGNWLHQRMAEGNGLIQLANFSDGGED